LGGEALHFTLSLFFTIEPNISIHFLFPFTIINQASGTAPMHAAMIVGTVNAPQAIKTVFLGNI